MPVLAGLLQTQMSSQPMQPMVSVYHHGSTEAIKILQMVSLNETFAFNPLAIA